MATATGLVKKKLNEAYSKELDNLAGCPLEVVKDVQGYLRGIKDAIKILEQVERDME